MRLHEGTVLWDNAIRIIYVAGCRIHSSTLGSRVYAPSQMGGLTSYTAMRCTMRPTAETQGKREKERVCGWM